MAYILNEEIFNRIKEFCLKTYDDNKTDPFQLLQDIWEMPGFPMHCPEHHVLVPAVLITVYRTLKEDPRNQLEDNLNVAEERGRNLLPGFCGYYGACGAGIGAGMFLSILTDTTPVSSKTWGLANQLTSESLGAIAAKGGPRCCKRVSFISLEIAVEFLKKHLNLDLGSFPPVSCGYHEQNRECLRSNCTYYPGE